MIRLVSSAVALGCGLIVLSLSANTALADKRVALVIGNSAYQNAPKLDNPVNDAAAIADMFRAAGFKVDARHDLGTQQFKRALRDFMDDADQADIAVVYFAGHGIEVSGNNYVIPVDARLEREYDAKDEASISSASSRPWTR
jgi:uncharacterized caspase-like protein